MESILPRPISQNLSHARLEGVYPSAARQVTVLVLRSTQKLVGVRNRLQAPENMRVQRLQQPRGLGGHEHKVDLQACSVSENVCMHMLRS